jgi:oligopeptide/dipeptide ABC transporter, ATP-binding protein, C-terminal domain
MYAAQMIEGGHSEETMDCAKHPFTQFLLSAVPDSHAGLRTRKEFGARGEVPSQINPPPGCPFATRCQKVMDNCQQVMPGKVLMMPEH